MPSRDWDPPCNWPACGLADSAIRSEADWEEFCRLEDTAAQARRERYALRRELADVDEDNFDGDE